MRAFFRGTRACRAARPGKTVFANAGRQARAAFRLSPQTRRDLYLYRQSPARPGLSVPLQLYRLVLDFNPPLPFFPARLFGRLVVRSSPRLLPSFLPSVYIFLCLSVVLLHLMLSEQKQNRLAATASSASTAPTRMDRCAAPPGAGSAAETRAGLSRALTTPTAASTASLTTSPTAPSLARPPASSTAEVNGVHLGRARCAPGRTVCVPRTPLTPTTSYKYQRERPDASSGKRPHFRQFTFLVGDGFVKKSAQQVSGPLAKPRR